MYVYVNVHVYVYVYGYMTSLRVPGATMRKTLFEALCGPVAAHPAIVGHSFPTYITATDQSPDDADANPSSARHAAEPAWANVTADDVRIFRSTADQGPKWRCDVSACSVQAARKIDQLQVQGPDDLPTVFMSWPGQGPHGRKTSIGSDGSSSSSSGRSTGSHWQTVMSAFRAAAQPDRAPTMA